MNISKVTIKGQIVIPSIMRKKYNIKKGSKVKIIDGNGEIVIVPLLDDPVSAGRGLLKGKGSLLKALQEDRREEAKR